MSKARIRLKFCSRISKQARELSFLCSLIVLATKVIEASGKRLSSDSVMSLVREDFLGSNIYCDHFYTGPVVLWHVWSLWRITMTQESTSQKQKKNPTIIHKVDPRGTAPVHKMDWNMTLHSAHYGFLNHWAKIVQFQLEVYHTLNIPNPFTVRDYISFMVSWPLRPAGYYSSSKKSRKWYMSVVNHFISNYLLLTGGAPMTHVPEAGVSRAVWGLLSTSTAELPAFGTAVSAHGGTGNAIFVHGMPSAPIHHSGQEVSQVLSQWKALVHRFYFGPYNEAFY